MTEPLKKDDQGNLPSYLGALDRLRAIALEGLEYYKNEYDKERYERILSIVSQEYGALSGFQKDQIEETFLDNIGIQTPRVCSSVLLLDTDDRVLLLKRVNNGCWDFPGGWIDVGDTPFSAAERELLEETGIRTKAKHCISISNYTPRYHNAVMYQITFRLYMEPVEPGTPVKLSDEHSDYKWIHVDDMTDEFDWHTEGGDFINKCRKIISQKDRFPTDLSRLS